MRWKCQRFTSKKNGLKSKRVLYSEETAKRERGNGELSKSFRNSLMSSSGPVQLIGTGSYELLYFTDFFLSVKSLSARQLYPENHHHHHHQMIMWVRYFAFFSGFFYYFYFLVRIKSRKCQPDFFSSLSS